MTFRQFLDKYHGKANDFDGAYSTQCVDLFNYYNRDVVGAGWIAGVNGAADIWTTTDSDINNSYVKLGNKAPVQQGDVLVWSKNMPGSGGYGHVAIAMDDQLNVIEQVPGSKAYTIKRDRNHLLGILRPKKFIKKEDTVARPTREDVAQDYVKVGRKADLKAQILHSTKGTHKTLHDGLMRDFWKAGYGKQIKDLEAQVKAKDAKIAQLNAKIKELEAGYIPVGQLYIKEK